MTDLAAFLSASETMKAELSGLADYLFCIGTDRGVSPKLYAERFIEDHIADCGYAKEYALFKQGGPGISKKAGSRVLSGLKAKVSRIFPLTESGKAETSASSQPVSGAAFSDIYVENGVLDHDLSREILARFPASKVAKIPHYKDIFNRAGQDFLARKRFPALILAENSGRRIYPGARPCQSFGHEHFYYASQVKNCLYDCEYCFLRGMYPSGNIVIFVNTEDYFADIDALLAEHPVYLSIAYDTDLLALEGITGMVEKWADYASHRPDLLIEIRTKCASETIIRKLAGKNTKNIILAYTISPAEVAARFEHGAGSTAARIRAMRASLNLGLRTRLCLDPMLAVDEYKKVYEKLVDDIFSDPVCKKLEDISVGTFRISKSYMKNMKKASHGPISTYPYSLNDGMLGYDEALKSEMLEFLKGKITAYYPAEKVFTAEF